MIATAHLEAFLRKEILINIYLLIFDLLKRK